MSSPEAGMRVLVADDHEVARAGLRQLVRDLPDVSEVGEASTGQRTLLALRYEGAWDLLILDLDMPDRSGLDILKHVRAGFPGTRILVVSGYPEGQFALQALRAGAHGYVPKSDSFEQITQAIQFVLSGRLYVSTTLAEQLAREALIYAR
jgi:two-component system, NarL family, invasion response regulator UvrY